MFGMSFFRVSKCAALSIRSLLLTVTSLRSCSLRFTQIAVLEGLDGMADAWRNWLTAEGLVVVADNDAFGNGAEEVVRLGADFVVQVKTFGADAADADANEDNAGEVQGRFIGAGHF